MVVGLRCVNLFQIHARDSLPFSQNGQVVLVDVGGTVIMRCATDGMPGRALWLVHDAARHPVFGRSVLSAAYPHWKRKQELGMPSAENQKELIDLNREIQAAMGIPTTSSEDGERAYWLTAEGRAQEVYGQVDRQILRPLTKYHLGGRMPSYTLEVKIAMPAWVRAGTRRP